MPGLLYLLLCLLTGYVFISLTLPQLFVFMKKSYSGEKLSVPSLFVAFPASLIAGMMLMAWPSYIFACIFKNSREPLAVADTLVMLAAAAFIVIGIMIMKKRLIGNLKNSIKNIRIYDIILLVSVFILAFVLMYATFNISGNIIGVGVSVYSDFATHMDMIRSFSHGKNFPATYSHYAGEDIKYHFMFQFFVGNLEFLGMKLDNAFNIPSILCFLSACMVIYALAIKIFARRTVGLLAVLFFVFRSGRAFGIYLAGLNGTLKEIWHTLTHNTEFVGATTNENWGLYNLNVYANQRHLAFGLTVILLAVLLMLPNVFFAVRRLSGSGNIKNFFGNMLFAKEGWLVLDYKTAVTVGVLLGMCSFFNGACVIGGLLVLFVLAFIADRRLEYLILASISVLMALIQSKVFIWKSAFSFRWEPGYLSEVKTFFGTAEFMYTLLGMFVLMICASFVFMDGWHRWILLAFISPILFAVCFQLTVDTAVNHKYIMMGVMFGDIFIAATVFMVLNRKGIFMKLTAGMLIILMTATGIFDLYTVLNRNSAKNGGKMTFMTMDPITEWVMANSDAKDIWLTDWYSLNSVTMGGAMLYYGWPYYAWSAGYDTEKREKNVHMMYQAESSKELKAMVQQNNIRFIVVDFPARNNENYYVNEWNIAGTYERVFSQGDGEWAFNIYDTSKPLKAGE